MIVIPIKSKIHGECFIFIDGEDFDKVKNYHWSIQKSKNSVYARTTIKGKSINMHRLLFGFPKSMLDHKNGNGLDNRRENIRKCTIGENGMNRKKQLCVSSVYKGVSQRKESKKYEVSIKLNGKTIHLGTFTNEHDAGEVYNKKAVELFGEFARLNIIRRDI